MIEGGGLVGGGGGVCGMAGPRVGDLGRGGASHRPVESIPYFGGKAPTTWFGNLIGAVTKKMDCGDGGIPV